MKTIRLIVTLAVVSFITAAVQAEEQKDAAKSAKCCAKAADKGEKCSHDCCAEAAKAGDNCAKCGGSGKAEPKK